MLVTEIEALRGRAAPLEMTPAAFRTAGHALVDQIADWLEKLPDGPVMHDESPADIRRALNAERGLPESGTDPGALLDEAATLLFRHSLFNGHPRFFGYITSSPAPIGALGDMLASAVNQNVGAWRLSPAATEIEAQTVRWIAELIGFPVDAGGLLVSGGSMANFVCFLAARTARVQTQGRTAGLRSIEAPMRVYASAETHTWIQKAADLFGLGTDAIRWIAVDDQQRMNTVALEQQILDDRNNGELPFLVVGTAGSVGTGAVDPLAEIAAICRRHDVWFHVDGAYGALAARVPGAPGSLLALSEADSVAVDPHKWLYAPLEAGCALVRRPADLRRTFSYHPSYYQFDHDVTNYFDYGPQNSRGFRALKVWLALRQVGLSGYVRMIGDDMRLARHLHALVQQHPDFEAMTQHLSITTFRYVPSELRGVQQTPETEAYLHRLNQELLARVERSGEAFLSNAMVGGRFALRACIVNFRTSLADIEALPPLLARLGAQADLALRRDPRA
jgi:aromatic-L-amino-acid decarboxylase